MFLSISTENKLEGNWLNLQQDDFKDICKTTTKQNKTKTLQTVWLPVSKITERRLSHFNCVCLRPHGLQHVRLPCPSPSPRACSNSCPLRSVTPSNHLILCNPLLLCLQSFQASRSFLMYIHSPSFQYTHTHTHTHISTHNFSPCYQINFFLELCIIKQISRLKTTKSRKLS